ncbi:MAG: hypothetical protein PUK40_01690 [Actinomycetaceae bacterium]|nr:hypothetical protein [Arcanobacterium sp.]MDD7504655.1 hypothetical protein [Actinomycetaceae bacterium]MDY6143147.1 hypothetical protein [Arcanobacterium sp.]
MDDAPRLSRKELREQGRLAARDTDAPSLVTETSELHLRRPSRREMREALRAQQAAEEKAAQAQAGESAASDAGEAGTGDPNAQAGAQGKVTSAPERRSVFERFTDDDTRSENHAHGDGDSGELANAEGDPRSEDERTDSQPMERPGEAPDTGPASNAGSGESDASGTDSATGVPDVEDGKASSSAADADKGSDTEGGASAEDHSQDGQDSRLHAYGAQEELDETPSGAGSSDASADQGDRDVAVASTDSEPNESTWAGNKLSDSMPEPVVHQAAGDGAEPSAANPNVVEEPQSSPKRTWIFFTILIIVGALLGYLGGAWINATFFSMGVGDGGLDALPAVLHILQ